MTLLDVVLWVLVVVAAIVAALVLFGPAERRKEAREGPGRSIAWRLDQTRATEIISNQYLGQLQRLEDRGGRLRPNDAVIVWAREFLDDDILYPTVRENIKAGVRYVYFLDRRHAARFRTLIERLKGETDLDERTVENGVDVVLVRSELLLNNFVLLSAETDRQVLYSALIFGDRPFAWLRQDHSRARAFLEAARHVLRVVAIESVRASGATEIPGGWYDSNRMLEARDQVMDYSLVGQILRTSSAAPQLDDVRLPLVDVVSRTTMPEDVEVRAGRVIGRISPPT